MYVCMYIYIYIYICTYVYIHTCVHKHMRTYMLYTFTYLSLPGPAPTGAERPEHEGDDVITIRIHNIICYIIL